MKPFLQRIIQFKKLFRVSPQSHPTRDWFVLLGVSAVLIGAVAGWNVWVFIVATTNTAQVHEAAVTPAFDTSVVDAVEKAFAERAEEADRYRSSYHFVDPSR